MHASNARAWVYDELVAAAACHKQQTPSAYCYCPPLQCCKLGSCA